MFFIALLLKVWSLDWACGISITRELVRISGLTLGLLSQNLHFGKIDLVAEFIDKLFKDSMSRCQNERAIAILNPCNALLQIQISRRENIVGLVLVKHTLVGCEDGTI